MLLSSVIFALQETLEVVSRFEAKLSVCVSNAEAVLELGL